MGLEDELDGDDDAAGPPVVESTGLESRAAWTMEAGTGRSFGDVLHTRLRIAVECMVGCRKER